MMPRGDGRWSGPGANLRSDGTYRVEGLRSGPARVTAKLAGLFAREKTDKIELAANRPTELDFRFAEGTAAFEGVLESENSDLHLGLKLTIATEFGPEQINIRRQPLKAGAFRLGRVLARPRDRHAARGAARVRNRGPPGQPAAGGSAAARDSRADPCQEHLAAPFAGGRSRLDSVSVDAARKRAL